MTYHTYAGYTLAEIKAAAEAATPGIWVAEPNAINGIECHCVGVADTTTCVASTGEVCDVKYGHQSALDADFIATASPAAVLALAARIEELERDVNHWKANHDNQVAKARLLITRGDLPVERISAYRRIEELEQQLRQLQIKDLQAKPLIARINELERERDTAVGARREAQMEAQLAREARNRSGIEAFREMRQQVKAAHLEGWRAARETAVTLCHEQWKAHSHEERVDACDDCAGSIRAMQPPAEWQCAEVVPKLKAITIDDAMKAAHRLLVQYVPPDWPHPDGFAGGLTERSE